MAHTYGEITVPSYSGTELSDLTPSGEVEDKLTWDTLATVEAETWATFQLHGKIRWCDWNYGSVWTDAWSGLNNPSHTYGEVTK